MKNAARKTVTLPNTLWAAVERYRLAEHIVTETETVRRLLVIALRSIGDIELSPTDTSRR